MRGVECVEISAKSILNRVAGMPFGWSINPYRGCYHGCVFCYARRTHSYFEDDGVGRWGSKIYVKVNGAAALRNDLRTKNREGERVCIGTATDPYQPFEGKYRITRGILEVLRDARVPVGIITRSPLIVRDIDILRQIARVAGVHVSVSVATMDETLAREIEPTVAPAKKRMLAVRKLADAGIDVGVALAPVLPHITDSEQNLRAVIAAAKEAGAAHLWHSTLNLGDVTRDAFFGYLHARQPQHLPQYEQMYRKKYVSNSISRAISERTRTALRENPMRPPPRIRTLPSGQLQLSLL